MDTETKTWITGEEYNRERRRLLDAGCSFPDAPEFQELMRRVDERNAYLFERYGRSLMDRHPGKWVAISIDGEAILGDRDVDVQVQARARFGPGNFSLRRLAEPPDHRLLSPREADA